jgi:diguanylate cyclase (GGDEF)-like protein/PAS domain S-box-containing protein
MLPVGGLRADERQGRTGRADIPGVRSRIWLAYPLAAVLAGGAYFALGHNSYLFNAIGLSSAMAILAAVRLHRPERRSPWYLIALGQTVFVAGDVVSYNYLRLHGALPDVFPLDQTVNPQGDVPFPGWADAFYLLVYPLVVAGVLLLIHARSPGRDRASLLDSLMLAIGLGTISWVLLIEPYTRFGDPLEVRLTAMAYPLMDLLLLAAAIRLAVGNGHRPPAFFLLLGAIVALFVTDAIYGWFGLYTESGYQPGSGWLEIGWAAFYVLLATASLHPSMRTLTERAPAVEPRLTWQRLGLLATAALVPPGLRIVQHVRGAEVNGVVLSGVSIVLFLLVVARMAGLIRLQERSARRERALRESAAALVSATSQEEIVEAAADAALRVAGDEAAVRICRRAEDRADELVVAAAAGVGRGIALHRRFPLSAIREERRLALLANRAQVIEATDSPLTDLLLLPRAERGVIVVAPLMVREELQGVMVIGTALPMPALVVEALEALTSQVSLALESAALTQDLLIRQSEARFASLVKNSSDVVLVIEPDTTVRYASPSAERVLGYLPDQLEGRRITELVHHDDLTRALAFLSSTADAEGHPGLMEFRVLHADGGFLYTETLRTTLLHDPNVRGIVLNMRDISERKAFEEQLAHQAFHDSVTGLANRALFRDRVTHALERRQRDAKPVAVLFMDLDDFKTVNDSMGHAAGDQLLREVGERIRSELRAADTAARLGGDEFAVLIEDGGEGIEAVDVADRLMRSLEAPFHIDGKEVYARASLGIAIAEGSLGSESGEASAEELLRNADVAMYMAKENGKGRYQVFEPAMHETALKRLELKGDLQRALDHEEFTLVYQPVMELKSGRVSGVEALLRWIHPTRGVVPPLEFIPLAEETGLIVPIGRWVLTEACRRAVALGQEFPEMELHMAVNLSARQIQRPEIVEDVREILAETGLEPRLLILEITESVMMQDMDLSIARLRELKELGVQLAIDDFGTGYSSLNYVRRFPVDILKVDKSFIDGVSEDGESAALTAAVIELAGILNLRPVAEGIERVDQLERLLQLRCDLGQGYLFAKPLPEDELRAKLTEWRQMLAELEMMADG